MVAARPMTVSRVPSELSPDVALALAQAEAGPDGLLVVSPEGRMVFRNKRFAEIWRFSPTVLGSEDDDVALEAAAQRVADPEAFTERVRRLYEARAGGHDDIVLRDGRVIERFGAPLFDADDAYLGYAWYFRDVTSQRRADEQLRELASTLQASLLPPRHPHVPGMDLAARYRPADTGLAVGGDFYDVFRLGPNDWGLAMGDVCGKGAPAAALTALTRYSLRAAAVHNFDPADVLRELNAAVRAEPETDSRFCSVVFARLELDVCGAWLTLACGGHPRPIVVRRAGWIDVRGMPGMLIGLFDDPEPAVDRVGLGPGDALVFCTDGITEARNASGEMFAEERLPAVLLECTDCDAETLADRMAEEALAFAGGRTHDDVAILVVRVPPDAVDNPLVRLGDATGLPPEDLRLPGYPVGDVAADLRSRRVLPPREARMKLAADLRSAAEARRFLAGVLHSWRMSELAEGDIELLTSEVCANAVRHARSGFTIVVRYDGERVRVEVGDGSRALPVPRTAALDDQGGRGMFLVDQLAHAWGVLPTVDGKRVWFEVAAPPQPL
jgi:sigma-B regulation protein RsbU (phosphoserine phosphatase)